MSANTNLPIKQSASGSEQCIRYFKTETHHIGLYFDSYKNSSTNEDSLFVGASDSILVGIFDGAGGHEKGEEASQIALQKTKDWWKSSDKSNPLKLIQSINNSILETATGARSTLLLAELQEDQCLVHNIGDSELITWSQKKGLLWHSLAHNTPGYLAKIEKIDADEAYLHPQRNEVYHLLGDEVLNIETSILPKLKKSHYLLAGSDGLFDNFSYEEIMDGFSSPKFKTKFFEFCEYIQSREIESLNKEDDISFVIVKARV